MRIEQLILNLEECLAFSQNEDVQRLNNQEEQDHSREVHQHHEEHRAQVKNRVVAVVAEVP